MILPPEPLLARGHYDVALLSLAIRNVANYSPPVFELQPGEMAEWEIMLRLAAIAAGQGAHADIDALDDLVIGDLVPQGGDAIRRQGRGPRRRRAPRRRSRRGAARSACSTSCCAPATTATGSAPTRDGLSLAAIARMRPYPHGASTPGVASAAPAPHPRVPAHTVGHDRARTRAARRRCRPPARTVERCERPRERRERNVRPRRPARPAIEQLVDAQRRRAREGQGALHGARASRRRGSQRHRRRRAP